MKIMIAEDEKIEALALQKILKQCYQDKIKQIHICKDGREAIIQAAKEQFDIIFMDINMPFIDGISAAAQIRIKDKKAKIIMLTAYSDFDYAKASIENQVFSYITKPYSVKTLKAVMDKLIFEDDQKQSEVAKESGIEDFILMDNHQGIQEYVERLWNKSMGEKDGISKEMIYDSIRKVIFSLEHYISRREREQLQRLAEDRLLHSTEYSEEAVKADCVYLLQKLGSQIHHSIDLNEEDIIVKAKKYIHTFYDQDIQLNDIADAISISKFYLSRIFKAKTGENIKDYLLKVRLEKAKQLLQKNYNVKEVAYKTGFNNPSYFSKCFKKEMKISPGEYKEQQSDQLNI